MSEQEARELPVETILRVLGAAIKHMKTIASTCYLADIDFDEPDILQSCFECLAKMEKEVLSWPRDLRTWADE